ncbi:bifunctional diaminohydroxyphosphoribosylaminopyrimidine deaminase/5-amino-6-(5-phosphoribosylamino)uracil reductase RibD [Amycolatopsis thermoflava]|uniref:bifunctional diaminohydroxyphosphoribosylaminopyrimidine deaminase/5-amino-6-(5-phosphoribosylamino)uracil reductase RibD n=1 Tax=Amycolatopsis thermoflava TaxID=84480 RepID=UPI00381B1C54
MASPTELVAMRRAISLAALGLGTTSPNPPVGCVILDRHGSVAGEGFHERKGEAHAETHALAMAGERARGGTAVVTLEPCNHYGRTPPCRKALIDAGIKRCVIAFIDPTSREEGGAARMRAAGIDVEIGVLADEARLVLGPWLHALQHQRPFVTWASVAHIDGIRAPLPAHLLADQRAAVDAVLTPELKIEEGVPNGHGPGMVSLDDVHGDQAPETLLAELHQAGARTVLLNHGRRQAAPFLDHDLVDQVVVYLATHPPGEGPIYTTADALLASRFSLRDVVKVDGFVAIKAVRD